MTRNKKASIAIVIVFIVTAIGGMIYLSPKGECEAGSLKVLPNGSMAGCISNSQSESQDNGKAG